MPGADQSVEPAILDADRFEPLDKLLSLEILKFRVQTYEPVGKIRSRLPLAPPKYLGYLEVVAVFYVENIRGHR